MSVKDVCGTRIIQGGPDPMPRHDNENLPLKPDWMTPAELMQWVRQERNRLSREVAANPQLWLCPEFRRTWDATLGIEQLALRQFGPVQE